MGCNAPAVPATVSEEHVIVCNGHWETGKAMITGNDSSRGLGGRRIPQVLVDLSARGQEAILFTWWHCFLKYGPALVPAQENSGSP